MLQERKLELEKPKSPETDSKQVCSLFWRETPSLSSKAIRYANIPEKTVWNKGRWCLSLQICRSYRDPQRAVSPKARNRMQPKVNGTSITALLGAGTLKDSGEGKPSQREEQRAVLLAICFMT